MYTNLASSVIATPNYAPYYLVLNNITKTPLSLVNRRFDIGDWNNDGLPDLVLGAYDAQARLYLNTNTTQTPAYGPYRNLMSGAYNWYPRMFDINHDGVIDLVRGINTGSVSYWFDPGARGLGSGKSFLITTSTGNVVSMKPITDGAIVDFGDINGDGCLDMVFGGHNNNHYLYIVYSSVSHCISTSVSSHLGPNVGTSEESSMINSKEINIIATVVSIILSLVCAVVIFVAYHKFKSNHVKENKDYSLEGFYFDSDSIELERDSFEISNPVHVRDNKTLSDSTSTDSSFSVTNLPQDLFTMSNPMPSL